MTYGQVGTQSRETHSEAEAHANDGEGLAYRHPESGQAPAAKAEESKVESRIRVTPSADDPCYAMVFRNRTYIGSVRLRLGRYYPMLPSGSRNVPRAAEYWFRELVSAVAYLLDPVSRRPGRSQQISELDFVREAPQQREESNFVFNTSRARLMPLRPTACLTLDESA